MSAVGAREEKKAADEKAAFLAFAKLIGLPVVDGSVQSRRPPEPDILCSLQDGGLLAFELGRLDSEFLREDLGKYAASSDALTRIVPSADRRRDALEAKFGRVVLCIDFMHDSSVRAREASLCSVVQWLVDDAHASKISRIVQIPAAFRPPIYGIRVLDSVERFDLVIGKIITCVTSHALLSLEKKLDMKYGTCAPIELLMHTEAQDWDVLELVRDQIEDLVLSKIDRSPYQRVWVADMSAAAASVKFVYPSHP